MSIVDEFWILNFEGVPLFHYSQEEERNYQLIGAFFSAIQSFARELSRNKKNKFVHQISLGNANYTFLVNTKYDLYFVSKSPSKIKEKQVNPHLKRIEEMFLDDFKSVIFDYAGDISVFEKFREKFKKYFDDNFIKLKGMW
jgi:hypothetical protein